MANIGLSLCFLSGVMVNFGQQQWDFWRGLQCRPKLGLVL
jgi:hypothetical protein